MNKIKHKKEPKVNNIILYINNKRILQRGYRNSSAIILKFLCSFAAAILLFLASQNFYITYQEKKRIKNEMRIIRIEVQSIQDKRYKLDLYRDDINKLLGYEVYKEYQNKNKLK